MELPFVVLTATLALAGLARADLINVLSTDRRVHATALVPPNSQTQDVPGPAAGSWSQTVTAHPPDNGQLSASATALQESTIGASSITGSFSVSGFNFGPGTSFGASSFLSVQFQMNESVSFAASASAAHSAPTIFQLIGPAGTVFSASPAMGNAFQTGGQLGPGVYTLTYQIGTTNSATSASGAQETFSVTPVPAAGTLTPLVLAAAISRRRGRPGAWNV